MLQPFFRNIQWSHLIALILAIAVDGAKAGHTASPISVETGLDKSRITLGDIITFSIIVRHDPGLEVSPPAVSIKGFDFVESGARKQDTAQEYWYRFRADETGSHVIDPVPVMFTSPDPEDRTKIQGQALTPRVTVEVESVLRLQGDPRDIRDIKPIIPIARDWRDYHRFGLALLVLVVLAILLWKLKKSPVIAQRVLPPHELAMHELELLRTKQLLPRDRVQEHYFALSEIFRRYLGARYSFPSLDWTTEEINSQLQKVTEPHLCEQAHSLLKAMDGVKFAKAAVSNHDEIMKSVMQFIQTTGRTRENMRASDVHAG